MTHKLDDELMERCAEEVRRAAEEAPSVIGWAYKDDVVAALSALRPGDVVGDGLMVVPVEPTEAMVDEGEYAGQDTVGYYGDLHIPDVEKIYRAMRAAVKDGKGEG